MTIDLGVLQLNEQIVLRQLRQDLRDDWFPDPRQFDDILSNDHIRQVVTDNFNVNAGAYKPLRPDLLDVPKANLTLRYSLETGVTDRAVYQGLVAYLIPFYDGLLPWSVFNHRLSVSRGSDKYTFRSPIESWRNFIGSVRARISSKPVLLSTDLTNYYENIDIVALKKTMIGLLPQIQATAIEKGKIRAHLQFLFDYLCDWCYTPDRGLPQNRDASSFLANMYLLPVDQIMIGHGYDYFRYMDDIKITCSDTFEARRALKDLNLALRGIGLAVNSGKTKICESSDAKTLADCLDAGDVELQKIAAIWNTRSLRPISRSFPILKDLTLRLLREGRTNQRSFRFCIRRLEALACCPEFAVPAEYFADITPLVIDALIRDPASTDQVVRYLRVVSMDANQLNQIADLIQDDYKSIYAWQNYWLWMLLVHKKHLTPQLMAYALSLVCQGNDHANRSGAILYAGALGGPHERIVVAQHFSKSGSFHGQRASLIAIQELNYKPHVEANVPSHLRADLKGVYKGLKDAYKTFGKQGIYLAPMEIMPITRYLDQDRNYD